MVFDKKGEGAALVFLARDEADYIGLRENEEVVKELRGKKNA